MIVRGVIVQGVNVRIPIIGHLNINSLRNKFNDLKFLVSQYIDILILSETKIDATSPTSQFIIPGCCIPYRFDRTRFGGGIVVYVREGIPNKLLEGQTQSNIIENICLELNLKSRKWFLCAIYNPHGENAEFFLRSLSVILDSYQKKYDNLILIGDFNLEPSNSKLQDFSINFSLNNLVQINTCFKNVSNPRCIDLILTNKKNHFQNTTTIETGISDFHKFVLTVLKAKYIKAKPKTIIYRDYKK